MSGFKQSPRFTETRECLFLSLFFLSQAYGLSLSLSHTRTHSLTHSPPDTHSKLLSKQLQHTYCAETLGHEVLHFRCSRAGHKPSLPDPRPFCSQYLPAQKHPTEVAKQEPDAPQDAVHLTMLPSRS